MINQGGDVLLMEVKAGSVDFQPSGIFKNWFFINFAVIFLSILENPAFQNFQVEHERHRVV